MSAGDMQKVKVLVVDDNPQMRRALVEVLSTQDDIVMVGQASDGAMAVERARALRPHVVIMDLNMPEVDGLEATSILHTELPDVRVLMYTVSESESDLFTAMQYGARGYILKSASAQELVAAVLYVAQGGAIVSPRMATKLLADLAHVQSVDRGPQVPSQVPSQAPSESLTQREEAVLKLVAKGATNSEIASNVGLLETEVKTALDTIMAKLHFEVDPKIRTGG